MDTGPGRIPARPWSEGLARGWGERNGACGHIFPRAEQLQAAQGTQERGCGGGRLLCSPGGSSQELGTAGARGGSQPAWPRLGECKGPFLRAGPPWRPTVLTEGPGTYAWPLPHRAPRGASPSLGLSFLETPRAQSPPHCCPCPGANHLPTPGGPKDRRGAHTVLSLQKRNIC